MNERNIRRESGAYASAGKLYAAISTEKKRRVGWVLHAKIDFCMASGKHYIAAAESFAVADYSSMESARAAASEWCCEALHRLAGNAIEITDSIRAGW